MILAHPSTFESDCTDWSPCTTQSIAGQALIEPKPMIIGYAASVHWMERLCHGVLRQVACASAEKGLRPQPAL